MRFAQCWLRDEESTDEEWDGRSFAEFTMSKANILRFAQDNSEGIRMTIGLVQRFPGAPNGERCFS
jgi:hypothetical protein